MDTLSDQISENSALPLVSADYAVQLIERFMNSTKCKREHIIKKMKHVYMMVETCDKILSVPDGECDEKTKGALRDLHDALARLHPWTRRTFEVRWRLSLAERSQLIKPPILNNSSMSRRVRMYFRRKGTAQANGETPRANGDAPGANGDAPGANGDAPGANGGAPGTNGNAPEARDPIPDRVKFMAAKLYVLSRMLETLPQKHARLLANTRDTPEREIIRIVPGYSTEGLRCLATVPDPDDFRIGAQLTGMENSVSEEDRMIRSMLDESLLGTVDVMLFRPAAESSTISNPYACHVTCHIDPDLYHNRGMLEIKWGRIHSNNPPKAVCQICVKAGDLSKSCWFVVESNRNFLFLIGE